MYFKYTTVYLILFLSRPYTYSDKSKSKKCIVICTKKRYVIRHATDALYFKGLRNVRKGCTMNSNTCRDRSPNAIGHFWYEYR